MSSQTDLLGCFKYRRFRRNDKYFGR